jgi:hypothetical protein
LYLAARWLRQDDVAARHLRTDEVLHALWRRPAGGVGAEAWAVRAEEALRAAAQRVADGDSTDAHGLVCEVAAQAYGTPLWGDKYNEYLLDLPYLHELYPRARWLFLYRHPVEVSDSMLRWEGDRPWRSTSAAACEEKWAEWNGRWLDFRDHVRPDRRLELSYDDVCHAAGAAGLADFAGISLTGAPLRRRALPAQGPPVTERAAEIWRRICELRERAATTSGAQ